MDGANLPARAPSTEQFRERSPGEASAYDSGRGGSARQLFTKVGTRKTVSSTNYRSKPLAPEYRHVNSPTAIEAEGG